MDQLTGLSLVQVMISHLTSQAITRTNDNLMLIVPLGGNFNEIKT